MARKKLTEDELGKLLDTSEDNNVMMEETEKLPIKMTLYQAWRRGVFSKDPEENTQIYMKKRRGYEGKERTVLIQITGE